MRQHNHVLYCDNTIVHYIVTTQSYTILWQYNHILYCYNTIIHYIVTIQSYTARSVEDETPNGHRNAKQNPNRNQETTVLCLFWNFHMKRDLKELFHYSVLHFVLHFDLKLQVIFRKRATNYRALLRTHTWITVNLRRPFRVSSSTERAVLFCDNTIIHYIVTTQSYTIMYNDVYSNSCVCVCVWLCDCDCVKLQVIFRKRATNYRALLRTHTCYKMYCQYNAWLYCHTHTHTHTWITVDVIVNVTIQGSEDS